MSSISNIYNTLDFVLIELIGNHLILKSNKDVGSSNQTFLTLYKLDNFLMTTHISSQRDLKAFTDCLSTI